MWTFFQDWQSNVKKKDVNSTVKVWCFGEDSEKRPPSKYPFWAVIPQTPSNEFDDDDTMETPTPSTFGSGSSSSAHVSPQESDSESSYENSLLNEDDTIVDDDDDISQWIASLTS